MAVTVSFLTDYGPGSEHVGALHAVLASRCPDADRIDLAHDLPPGDIRYGATVFARLVPLTPVGVHVAVIDPGVGTTRRAVAIACRDGRLLVGPDNGLLLPTAQASVIEHVVEATAREHHRDHVAATFHGRDIFAPVAAALASGAPLGDLGERVDPATLVVIPQAESDVSAGRVRAQMLGADRFGNIELVIGAPALAEAGIAVGDAVSVEINGRTVTGRMGEVFADVPIGDVLVYINSHATLAIAVRNGDARDRFDAVAGQPVTITVRDA